MSESLKICGISAIAPLPGDPSEALSVYANTSRDGVKVTWTFPAINSHSIAYYQVYRGVDDNAANAQLLVATAASEYYDIVEEEEVGNTYYYWVVHTSINGTVSTYNGPAIAIAGNWIAKIIDGISGEIKASDLAISLRSEIASIPSLRTDLLNETTGRLEAIEDIEFSLSNLGISIGETHNAIVSETEQRSSELEQYASQIEAISVSNGQNLAAILLEQSTRVTAISAEASARESLAVRTSEAEAAIVTNKTLAANASGALSSRVDTVVANQINTFRQDEPPTEAEGRKLDSIWIDTNDGNHIQQWNGSSWVSMRDAQIAAAFAAINTEQTARTTSQSAFASELTTIESSVTTVAGDLVQAQTDIETDTQQKLDTLNTALGNDLISSLASAKSYTDDEALAAKQAAVADANAALSAARTDLETDASGKANAAQQAAITDAENALAAAQSELETYAETKANDAKLAAIADAQAALDAAKTNLETKIETDIADFDSVTAQQIIDAASDLSIYIDEIDDTITVNENGSINLPDGRTLQVNGGATISGKPSVYNRAGRLEHANGDIVSGESNVLIKAENVRGTLLRLAKATADITKLRDVTIDAKIIDNNSTAVGFCLVDGQPSTNLNNKFTCLWTDEALNNPRPNAQWLPLGSIAEIVRGIEINTANGGTVKIQDRMQAYDTGLEDVENLADGLKAEYTLKIDADPNGTGDNIIGGFGLALDENDRISAGFNVDKFWVGEIGDTYDSATLPFFIQGGNTYINSAYIADASIGVAQIIDLSVSVAKIQDLAVTTAKIDNLAIKEAKIANAAITRAKIEDLAVTGAKIDNATIKSANIGIGEIETANIDTAAITSAKIQDLSVDTLKIAGNAVTTSSIYSGDFVNLIHYADSTSPATLRYTLDGATTADAKALLLNDPNVHPISGVYQPHMSMSTSVATGDKFSIAVNFNAAIKSKVNSQSLSIVLQPRLYIYNYFSFKNSITLPVIRISGDACFNTPFEIPYAANAIYTVPVGGSYTAKLIISTPDFAVDHYFTTAGVGPNDAEYLTYCFYRGIRCSFTQYKR